MKYGKLEDGTYKATVQATKKAKGIELMLDMDGITKKWFIHEAVLFDMLIEPIVQMGFTGDDKGLIKWLNSHELNIKYCYDDRLEYPNRYEIVK